MTEIKGFVEVSAYVDRTIADAYARGFSAGMIDGRKKGVEEAAKVCERKFAGDDVRSWADATAKLLSTAIRSLITTGDAEKENGK